MFDSVGRNLDQDAARRQLIAAPLTFLAFGSVVCAYLLSVLVRVWLFGVSSLVELPTDDEMMAVELEDPTLEDAPPPPPPPPASGAQEVHEDEVKPDAEEPVEEVKPLDEKVVETIKDDAVAGSDKGVEGGQEGGVEGGQVGGVEGGVVGGTGVGVRTIHWSEVEVKKRVKPVYPKAAQDLNFGDADCRVRVFIDEAGTPYKLDIAACPRVFQDDTKEAVMQWRWYPSKDPGTGKKAPAQFLLNFHYVMTD